jgi:hypothetical protein
MEGESPGDAIKVVISDISCAEELFYLEKNAF